MDSLLALTVAGALLAGLVRGAAVYDAFLRGAGEGMALLVKTAPNLFAAVLCAGMLQKSGVMAAWSAHLGPFLTFLGLPEEILPLFLVRPVSGSAALALVERLMAALGPDSYPARVACAMMGSTETVFYTVAVYTAGLSVPPRSMRRILTVCLLTCAAGAFFAAWVCRRF